MSESVTYKTVSVKYPYDENENIDVCGKYIIDDTLHVAYKIIGEDKIYFVMINVNDLIMNKKYIIDNAYDIRITNQGYNRHDFYILSDKLYIYNGFSKIIKNAPTDVKDVDIKSYAKVLGGNFKVDPKIPENSKIFAVSRKKIFICGYDDLYYIMDVIEKVVYIYDLDVGVRDKILGEYNNVKKLGHVQVNDIFMYDDDYIVLLTDRHKFIFKTITKSMLIKDLTSSRNVNSRNIRYVNLGRLFMGRNSVTEPYDDEQINDIIDYYLNNSYKIHKNDASRVKWEKEERKGYIKVINNYIFFVDGSSSHLTHRSYDNSEVLLKSSISDAQKYIHTDLLLRRSKVFSDMKVLFDNEKDLYASLQTEITNEFYEYINCYYDYIYDVIINKNSIIDLFKICNYLIDIDCNFIALCMINLCIYGNISGEGKVINDMYFSIKCLKLLNNYGYPEFFLLLTSVYQNYD